MCVQCMRNEEKRLCAMWKVSVKVFGWMNGWIDNKLLFLVATAIILF